MRDVAHRLGRFRLGIGSDRKRKIRPELDRGREMGRLRRPTLNDPIEVARVRLESREAHLVPKARHVGEGLGRARNPLAITFGKAPLERAGRVVLRPPDDADAVRRHELNVGAHGQREKKKCQHQRSTTAATITGTTASVTTPPSRA